MRKAFLLFMSLFAMIAAGTGLSAQGVTIILQPGWNWIGYPYSESADLETAFGDFVPLEDDEIKSRFGYSTYDEDYGWFGGVDELKPGWGYMYYSNRTTTVMVVLGAPASPSTVATATPTDITAVSAVVGGMVMLPEGSHVFLRGVCWGTAPNPDIDGDHTEDGTGIGSFSNTLEGLNPNTTYYVRAYAVSDNGLAYGNEVSFTTMSGIPVVNTAEVTDITGDGATCGGTVTDNGGLDITVRGVCWSTSHNPTLSDSHTTDGTGMGEFTSSITGLSTSTTYYVRAYATTAQATSYGEEMTFTTMNGIPAVSTADVTDITSTSATCGGNVTADGGLTITARGVCWSTSHNPTLSDSHTIDGTGTGSFTSSLTGLSASTTYYVRAYATNSVRTSYGDEVSFITPSMQNAIVNGDFEAPSGYVEFTDYVRIYSPYVVEAGHYAIDNTTSGYGGGYGWPSLSNSHGKFMMVNGFGGNENPSKVVWRQTVTVTKQTTYTMTYRVANLNQVCYGQIYPAKLQIKINGTNMGSAYQLPTNNNWQDMALSWNSGNNTSAIIEFYDVSTSNSGMGDDFCLDDISFVPDVVYSVEAVNDTWPLACYLVPSEIPVLDNDIISPGIQNATVQILVQPTHGEAYVLSNKKIEYLFNDASFSGTDQLKYRVGFSAQNIWDEAWVYIQTGQSPIVGNIAGQGPICAGGALNIPTPSVNPSATGQWEKSTSQNGTFQTFDPNIIPLSMNGNWVRYSASNDCGEGYSNAVQITVTNGPSFTGQTPQVSPICAGGSLNLTPPAFNSNGSQILSQGWVASQTENGTYTTFNNNSLNNIPASYNGWYIRYMVEGSCGYVYSCPSRQLTVNVAPDITGTLQAPPAICACENLNVTAPTYYGTGTGSWEICQTPNGSYQPFNINNVPITYNNWYLHYKVSNDCGSDVSNAVQITVIDCSGTAPTGAIDGKFTINASGDQVYFSQGNLQYIGSAATPYWKFADNQWDCFGNSGQGSTNQNVDRDLFGWGTSGWHDSSDPYNVNYQPWSTSTSIVNSTYNCYGYGPSTNMPSPNLTGSSANYDWGVFNPISNGGNQTNQWRTLTQPEWDYVFYTRTTTSGIRYAKANVNNVNGVILLLDDWNSGTYNLSNTNSSGASFSSNTISASQLATLEEDGAVFLPTAGHRNETSVLNVGSYGYYWSALSSSSGNSEYAVFMRFNDSNLYTAYGSYRYDGFSVRLVAPAEN